MRWQGGNLAVRARSVQKSMAIRRSTAVLCASASASSPRASRSSRRRRRAARGRYGQFLCLSLADPPLVLWSISRRSRSFSAFEAAGLCDQCSGLRSDSPCSAFRESTTPTSSRTSRWSAGRMGAPLIDGAVAHLECDARLPHEGGDHLILLGRVAPLRAIRSGSAAFRARPIRRRGGPSRSQGRNRTQVGTAGSSICQIRRF